ncbi:MAG: 4'-phosphopantetheinyl transferase superfamily protein [Patescibacteria group bacterium]
MDKLGIKKQRALARSLVYELTGKEIKHLKTGRPFIDRSMDISISHKNDLVGVGIVPSPYRIGIDIERVDTSLNAELFFGPVITQTEQAYFRTFCEDNNFSLASGVAIFWSIKEAFFKCLDYDLKPGKISVLGISKLGKIQFGFSDEIEKIMKENSLKIHSAIVSFKGEYAFSQTVMSN